MCDTRTNTIVGICRRGADAEHDLSEALAELSKGFFLNGRGTDKLREAVVARSGTEGLRFLERVIGDTIGPSLREQLDYAIEVKHNCDKIIADLMNQRDKALAQVKAREMVER